MRSSVKTLPIQVEGGIRLVRDTSALYRCGNGISKERKVAKAPDRCSDI